MANTMTSDEFIQYTEELSASGKSIGYNVLSSDADPQSDALRIIRINILDKDTGEAIEEVDVLTTADAVIFSNGRTLPEELMFQLQYSNSTPIPVAIGGIPAGTTFSGINLKDLFTQLLYPYTKPNIKISLSVSGTYFEKDVNISPVIVTVNVEKKSEDIKSVDLYVGGSKLQSVSNFPVNGGTATSVITTPITTTTEIYAKVDDGKGVYDSNKITLIFNRPIYIGCMPQNIEITSDKIKQLSSNINYPSESNISITKKLSPTNEHFFIAYPNQYNGNETVTVYDTNGFNITHSFERFSINVLDGNSNPVEYICMGSNVTTQSQFDITFKLSN